MQISTIGMGKVGQVMPSGNPRPRASLPSSQPS
jgi:hypothetical protein